LEFINLRELGNFKKRFEVTLTSASQNDSLNYIAIGNSSGCIEIYDLYK